jgi:hypothetical protein
MIAIGIKLPSIHKRGYFSACFRIDNQVIVNFRQSYCAPPGGRWRCSVIRMSRIAPQIALRSTL